MTSTDALLDAVYAAPDDDAPRRLLGEALRKRGDPWGDFILLQLAVSSRREEKARERSLLRTHQAEWLQPLRGALVAKTVRWDRGFPVAGRLALQKTDAARNALVGCPALATLRELDMELGIFIQPMAHMKRFLFDSPLRGLRVLVGMPRGFLPRLLASRPSWKLEAVDCALEGGGGPQGVPREQAEMQAIGDAFGRAVGAPELRTLGLSFAWLREPTSYAWLWQTAAGRRIRRLRVNLGAYGLPEWYRALAAHVPPAELEVLELFTAHRFELRRTDLGWTRLEGAIRAEHYADNERTALTKALVEMPDVVDVGVDGR